MEIAIFCTFGSEAKISHVDFRRYEEARNVWGQKIFSPEVTLGGSFNLRLTLEFP